MKPKTVSADSGFEAGEFLRTLEEDLHITPHVPITAERVTSRGAGGDARRRMLRRMKTKGYALSQRARKKIEQMLPVGRRVQPVAIGPSGGSRRDSIERIERVTRCERTKR